MNDQNASPVTAVIINFRTLDLTSRAVASFRAVYPSTPLLLIDNGSGREDAEALQRLAAESSPRTATLLLPRNIHHGPAMDVALHHLSSPFVLFMDSDCNIRRGGFVEGLYESLQSNPLAYAAGKKIALDDRGFDVRSGAGHPYIRPICMLVKRELYFQLPPFRKHGAPCLANMRRAVQEGFLLVTFPVDEYITHEGRGTASRHGYRLGLSGKLNHLLHRFGF
jgi:Glycosyl transferase family 2